VDIFFWISGFLNYYSFAAKLSNSVNKRMMTAILALTNRFFRLYPVLWMAIIYMWKVNKHILEFYTNVGTSESLARTKVAEKFAPEGI